MDVAALHRLEAHPSGPLHGALRVPGDKSISHRALILASLAIGESRITGLLEGEDVLRTAAACRALGAEITRAGDEWRVNGRGVGGLREPEDVLDMGNSGTGARLLSGVLASHPMFSVLTGDASLRRRPMRRVTEPLAACGARFTARTGGLLPMAIEGAREALPLDYRVPVPSAQVKSAVLLAGLNARGETEVEEPVATRDHTEIMLRHFGAKVAVEVAGEGRRIRVAGQPELTGSAVEVPADFSSAAFPLIAALIVPGSEIHLETVGLNPLRTGLLECLEEMGAEVAIEDPREQGGEAVGDIRARFGALTAIEVPPERAPRMIDEYPILAVACAFAAGRSRFRGLRELRVKESDRLTATARLLEANGISVAIEGDDLVIEGAGGPPAGGGMVTTALDHRIAMSALVLGLGAKTAVAIDDPRPIETSFPGFERLMTAAGARFGTA